MPGRIGGVRASDTYQNFIHMTAVANWAGGTADRISRDVLVDSMSALAVGLTAERATVEPGGTLSYGVTFVNRSAAPVSDITLRVLLPTGIQLVGASGAAAVNADQILWSLGTLAPGQTGYRPFTVAAGTARPGETLVSTASLVAGLSDQAGMASGTTVAFVKALGGFQFRATAHPSFVAPGGVTTLAITATNKTAVRLRNFRVQALVPDHLDVFVGAATDAYCINRYDICSPGHLVTWELDGIMPGASRTVLLPARVSPSFNSGTIHLTATAIWDEGRGETVSINAAVHRPAGLALSMSADRASAPPGGTLTYRVMYINRSATMAHNATIRATVAFGARVLSISDAGGEDNREVVWQLGSVPPGQSGVRQFRIEAPPEASAHASIRASALAEVLLDGVVQFSSASVDTEVKADDTEVKAERTLRLTVSAHCCPS